MRPSNTVRYQSPAGVLNNCGFDTLLPEWIICLEQWICGDVSAIELQRDDTSGQGAPAAGQSLCSGIFVLVMKTSHGTD